MTCIKVGQQVKIHPTDPKMLVVGDLYQCPSCAMTVIVGLTDPLKEEHPDEDAIELISPGQSWEPSQRRT
jgi:hypothetical protein